MTSRHDYTEALRTVSLILLGRRIALKTNHLRNDPQALLDVAEETHKQDLKDLDVDDADFETRAKQVTRKLEAVKSLRVLATAFDEFDW